MKLKKLIRKTEAFLSSDKRKRKEKKKYLKHVLKELRQYEEQLSKQLETETDPQIIVKLKRKIALTHKQREKGVLLLKQLKHDDSDQAEQQNEPCGTE